MIDQVRMSNTDIRGQEGISAGIVTLEEGVGRLRADLSRLRASSHAPRVRQSRRSDDALSRAAADVRAQIDALRAEDDAGSGFVRQAFERTGLHPDMLHGLLAANAQRRRALEDALQRTFDDAAGTLYEAVLAERAAREEGERRLLRRAADVATLLRAEFDAEREARAQSERLLAQLTAHAAETRAFSNG
jgi:hypothetical protein